MPRSYDDTLPFTGLSYWRSHLYLTSGTSFVFFPPLFSILSFKLLSLSFYFPVLSHIKVPSTGTEPDSRSTPTSPSRSAPSPTYPLFILFFFPISLSFLHYRFGYSFIPGPYSLFLFHSLSSDDYSFPKPFSLQLLSLSFSFLCPRLCDIRLVSVFIGRS